MAITAITAITAIAASHKSRRKSSLSPAVVGTTAGLSKRGSITATTDRNHRSTDLEDDLYLRRGRVTVGASFAWNCRPRSRQVAGRCPGHKTTRVADGVMDRTRWRKTAP